MRGVQWLARKTFADERGRLDAFEAADNLPFVPARVFLIEIGAEKAERGGHANSCAEVIIAIRGRVTIVLDNGAERESIALSGGDRPLCISAGILIRLTEFEPGTLLLVCAPEPYARTRHFQTPQPDLVVEEAFR